MKGARMVPAVVLGSSDGGRLTSLQVATPCVSRWDPRRMNRAVSISADHRTVYNEGKWGTALVDHIGARRGGIVRFALHITGDGGVAIGFVNALTFRPQSQNLGTCEGTWGLSKTGKISRGNADGFTAFGDKLQSDDRIACEADMNEGVIRMWRNGISMGVVFASVPTADTILVPAVCIGNNLAGRLSQATLIDFPATWLTNSAGV